ncbi:hypothetical protein NOSIN_15040 [Nocardiopsis sinuspersici]|uniref:Uncharacterized protein n=1 Tax=Nocardiopsis sinuspersici TaxID=501010 RepID=A0A1V3C2U5_9ACTN|nr:hypothetical protein NOSIN_15040 [Nocardiopsis sinuspersici]
MAASVPTTWQVVMTAPVSIRPVSVRLVVVVATAAMGAGARHRAATGEKDQRLREASVVLRGRPGGERNG